MDTDTNSSAEQAAVEETLQHVEKKTSDSTSSGSAQYCMVTRTAARSSAKCPFVLMLRSRRVISARQTLFWSSILFLFVLVNHWTHLLIYTNSDQGHSKDEPIKHSIKENKRVPHAKNSSKQNESSTS